MAPRRYFSSTSKTIAHLPRVPTRNANRHSRVLNMTGSSPEDDETDEAAWQAIIKGLGPLTVPPADSNSTDTSPEAESATAEDDAPAASSWRAPSSSERSLADLFNDDHLDSLDSDTDDTDNTAEEFVP